MDSFHTQSGISATNYHQRISIWRTSSPPSSGYGTVPTSHTQSTGYWKQQILASASATMPDRMEEKENQCCSLINSIWKSSHFEIHRNYTSAQLNSPPQPELSGLDSLGCSSRDNPTRIVNRPIVTLDAEQIGPQDQRHHPLDVEKSDIFIRKPWGIAINSRTEQIYLTDRQYNVILVFGPDGEYQNKFGGPGSEPGLFNKPAGLAYDATKDIVFVTDKDNHRVQAFSATSGQFLFAFGSRGNRPGQLSYPWGITVSPNGKHIAVADARNHRIQLFTSTGKYIRYFVLHAGSNDQRGRTIHGYPRGIVFDKAGHFLYVSDFNLHRIIRLDINFRQAEIIVDEQHLRRPSGVEVDHNGNILVCDTRHNLIKIFRPDGHPVGFLHRIGNSRFDLPLDVSVMPAGQIAVLDLNGRVRVF